MALDKIKTDVIADTNVTIAKLATNTGIKSDRHSIPSLNQSGVNAMSSPQPGDLVYNSTIGKLQQYTGDNAWRTIDSPPVLNSISPTTSADGGTTITLTGSNFSSTISAVNFIGTNGTKYAASSFTRVSSTSVTAVTPDLLVAHEPYDVEITNDTGLSAILEDALDAGGSPSFTNFLAGLTSAGQNTTGLIASIIDSQSTNSGTLATIAATDPDGGAITYAETGTSVWAGKNIAIASNGAVTVSGAIPDESDTATTYTQAVRATDAAGNTVDQNLKIYIVHEPTSTGGSWGSASTYTGYKAYKAHNSSNESDMAGSTNIVTYGNTLVDIFMIGGGGGGGCRHAGGGGAGGAIEATNVLLPAGTFTVAGGRGAGQQPAANTGNTVGGVGTDLTFTQNSGSGWTTWTAKRGGGGANHDHPDGSTASSSFSGGCGGGAGLPNAANNTAIGGTSTQGSAPSFTGATVTAYGTDGATVNGTTHGQKGGGGGGGIGGGGLGPNATNAVSGLGGVGRTNSFLDGNANGTTVGTHHFGGGGSGGGHGGTGAGSVGYGAGAGGNQVNNSAGTGGDGVMGTGAGGGGGGSNGTSGGRGGNGAFIYRHRAG